MSDKKRKRPKRMLVKGDKVEVRSLEDGFQGSWHTGVIVKCGRQVRLVEYDHLLCDDDDSELLSESVTVPGFLDGNSSMSETFNNIRCRIRPAPPVRKLVREEICYGLCVDAFYNDAWWEGVVVDGEVGLDNRKLFFPDLGDEMMVNVDLLRVTHDWNEVTGEWSCRGNWLFLEILQKHEMGNGIPVSIRQLWYDVRVTIKFCEPGEWASPEKLRENDILQIVDSNLDLTIAEFLSQCDFSKASVEKGEPSRAHNPIITNEPNSSNSSVGVAPGFRRGVLTKENEDKLIVVGDQVKIAELALDSLDASPSSTIPAYSSHQMVTPSKASACCAGSDKRLAVESMSKEKSMSDGKCLFADHGKAGRPIWVPKPEYNPQSVTEYINLITQDIRASGSLIRKVRNHLHYMGWKIEFVTLGSQARVRYTTPDGKTSHHLCPLLRKAKKSLLKECPSPVVDHAEGKMESPPVSFFSYKPRKNEPWKLVQIGKFKTKNTEAVPYIEPKFCPEIVFVYLKSSKTTQKDDGRFESLESVRRHLASIGWKFWIARKYDRDVWRYGSPTSNTLYYSLKIVCRAFENGKELNPSTPCQTEVMACSEEQKGLEGSEILAAAPPADGDHCSQTWSRNSSDLRELRPFVKRFKRKKNSSAFLSQLENCGAKNYIFRRHADGNKVTRVLRSSKRVRQGAPSRNSRFPLSIISWLIDNKLIMSGGKVFYHSKSDSKPVRVGRVTRKGIKCSCCSEDFSLSGFEYHAKSNYYEPAANIFTEEGKSLADLQVEILRKRYRCSSKKLLERVKKNRSKSWNDNICSICHWGGKLVLCDQCPSSFHASCLNLPSIPEGDWFCPSCCCGICGESEYDVNTGHLADNCVLCCYQCRRNYHAHCIRDKEKVELDSHLIEHWFCCKMCEKVHWGLKQLLGKRILVGHDSLSWTIINLRHFEEGDNDYCDLVTMAEHYGKLNLALEVMRECFKPVIEPRTNQDILEDVIFSRGSDLNRLNFRGFYTVILERNDELISVATLRVYGNKAAEIPLIGTRFQHRRVGMCRILMNEIEKNLVKLGVEKLVLPAAENVLNTWTTSFGFSVMKDSEKSEFLGYTFLDFQDTILCQKLLRRPPVSLSHILKDLRGVLREPRRSTGLLDVEGHSDISEVSQEQQREGSETVDQERSLIGTNEGDNAGPIMTDCPIPCSCAYRLLIQHSKKAIQHSKKANSKSIRMAEEKKCGAIREKMRCNFQVTT